VSTIQISPAVSDHQAVREAFGQTAYAGLLPRDQWSTAQDLLNRYDDARDDATRAAVAGRMVTMSAADDVEQRWDRIAA
jgi:hypothetical protein